jgi:uncharacterized membrane protein YfcA
MVVCYALRGSTGFGAAAAMPLLGIVIPMKMLVPAWTLVGLVASVTLFGQDRHHVAWREMVKLAPACVVGILAGLYVFTVLDSSALARGLGILVLLYGLHSLWATVRPLPRWNLSAHAAAPIAGLFGGIVGTAFGTMASVFFAMYFDTLRKGKEQFRATMNAILLALVVLRGAGYWRILGRRAHPRRRCAATDVRRHLHRQSHSHRAERTRLPPARGRRTDRKRRGAAREERLKSEVPGPDRRHLQVLAMAVSISLIDLSSDESEALLLSPSRHSAITARKARVLPRYSPLALQNMFLTDAFFLSSAASLVAFLMSSMVWSRVFVATNCTSSSALTTVSQSSSARAGASAASSSAAAITAVHNFIAVPFFSVVEIRRLLDGNFGRPGSFAILVDLGLQLPDRAIEARERLRAVVAFVETFVDDHAERLDESETLGEGRAQRSGIVAALGGGIGLVDQNLDAFGHGFAFVGLCRRSGKADRRRGHHSGSHGVAGDHAVSSAPAQDTYHGQGCHAARECASVKLHVRLMEALTDSRGR